MGQKNFLFAKSVFSIFRHIFRKPSISPFFFQMICFENRVLQSGKQGPLFFAQASYGTVVFKEWVFPSMKWLGYYHLSLRDKRISLRKERFSHFPHYF